MQPLTLPPGVYSKLNAFLAMTLQDAADTDSEGVRARLEPAVDDLYANTPSEAHAALTMALLQVAGDYALADEMTGITQNSRQNAALSEDDDDEEEEDDEDA